MGTLISNRVSRGALLIAMTTVATMVIRIPNPATQGYINLGDCMVFTVALLFGGRMAGLAGGLGSALADGLGGYFIWAPWTLVIKGVEGLVVGWLAAGCQSRFRGGRLRVFETGALLVGGIWMVSGYYLAGMVLIGVTAAVTEIPGNILQAAVGMAVALPLSTALRRALKQESQ